MNFSSLYITPRYHFTFLRELFIWVNHHQSLLFMAFSILPRKNQLRRNPRTESSTRTRHEPQTTDPRVWGRATRSSLILLWQTGHLHPHWTSDTSQTENLKLSWTGWIGCPVVQPPSACQWLLLQLLPHLLSSISGSSSFAHSAKWLSNTTKWVRHEPPIGVSVMTTNCLCLVVHWQRNGVNGFVNGSTCAGMSWHTQLIP